MQPTAAATNSRWVFLTPVDVNLSLSLNDDADDDDDAIVRSDATDATDASSGMAI
jgi:hypothetical protein